MLNNLFINPGTNKIKVTGKIFWNGFIVQRKLILQSDFLKAQKPASGESGF